MSGGVKRSFDAEFAATAAAAAAAAANAFWLFKMLATSCFNRNEIQMVQFSREINATLNSVSRFRFFTVENHLPEFVR